VTDHRGERLRTVFWRRHGGSPRTEDAESGRAEATEIRRWRCGVAAGAHVGELDQRVEHALDEVGGARCCELPLHAALAVVSSPDFDR